MARRPRKLCKVSGCRKLAVDESGYCDKPNHKPTPYRDDNRPNSTQRGYGYRWEKTTRRWKREAPRYCAECLVEGKKVVGDVVDHIIPVEDKDDPLFWDETNWQSLCHLHHNRKTRRDLKQGLGRRDVIRKRK